MTNWALLRDSHGTAEAIPDLLAQAAESPEAHAWTYLWPRLSDSMGTYSASYAVLPALTDIARSFPPKSRSVALDLAGSIVSHFDRPDNLPDPFTAYPDEVAELRRLTEETLTDPEAVSGPAYYNTVLNLLTFEGIDIRTENLDCLGGPVCQLHCPHCGRWILVVFGESGYYSTYYSTINWSFEDDNESERIPLLPTSPTSMNHVAKRMHDRALDDGRPDIATMLTHALGSARCGGCGSLIDVLANAFV